jgi:ABC-2 type transport system permease protein
VAWWEVPLALVLLVAAIWIFRRAAGKIFAVGMLMYGKEPSVREIWRWAREG